MKKWFLIAVLLLVGCSDDQAVSSSYPPADKENKPEMSAEVQVYSTEGNAAGYIVKANDRDKWLLTVGSVVANHPKVLIVTKDQMLEGEVVHQELDQNIAIVHMRNSATVTPYEISGKSRSEHAEVGKALLDHQQIKAYTSYTKSVNDAQAVPLEVLQQVTEHANQTALDFEERQKVKAYYAAFESYVDSPDNQLAAYKKQTFLYNPDDLYVFIEAFQKDFEVFLQDGKLSTLSARIATDSLEQTFRKLQEMTTGKVTFQSVEWGDVQLIDHQYVITGNIIYTEKGQQIKGTITYKIIGKNKQWQVVSMTMSN